MYTHTRHRQPCPLQPHPQRLLSSSPCPSPLSFFAFSPSPLPSQQHHSRTPFSLPPLSCVFPSPAPVVLAPAAVPLAPPAPSPSPMHSPSSAPPSNILYHNHMTQLSAHSLYPASPAHLDLAAHCLDYRSVCCHPQSGGKPVSLFVGAPGSPILSRWDARRNRAAPTVQEEGVNRPVSLWHGVRGAGAAGDGPNRSNRHGRRRANVSPSSGRSRNRRIWDRVVYSPHGDVVVVRARGCGLGPIRSRGA